MNTFISKLGKTRAGERSRIWLEGKRLTAAGFSKGMPFSIIRNNQSGEWVIIPKDSLIPDNHAVIKNGTIAGTDQRPIIDTVGSAVIEAFGNGNGTVLVDYGQLFIAIRKGV